MRVVHRCPHDDTELVNCGMPDQDPEVTWKRCPQCRTLVRCGISPEGKKRLQLAPLLPMRPNHVRQILEGTKTTTLRAQRMTGLFKLESRQCGNQLVLACRLEPIHLVNWANLDDEGKAALAATEGYKTLEGFTTIVKTILRRTGQRWLAGELELYLHAIQEVTRIA